MVQGRVLLGIVIMVCAGKAVAQKQLVFLDHETVLKRFYPGDDFVFKLKGSKSIVDTYVNDLYDTAVMTHADVVPFRKIDRVYFTQHKFYNTIGTLLVIGGAGYFLIDQLNLVVVHGNKASLNKSVSTVSIVAIGVGLPLMLFKKRSQRLNYRHQLLTVKKGSAFYRPDPRGFDSPYLPD